ncbi:HWE histidine kinase domain-containing protein, partial [Brevundimonas sp.]|uniref:HWE histidine kinase domain-containing protein n=1 Tax=Brevundimonas sp. TaxID=1871086 RepID=UPI003A1029D1
MPMLFTDARAGGNPILFANDAFLAMTQYPRDEVLGRPFKFFMAGENNLFDVSLVDEAFQARTGGHFEMRDRRRDGSVFWAAVFTHPVPDMEGRIVDHFVSFVDLTDHKREAENLRVLLDELNHRTQNTLATVQALTVQTLRGLADASVISTLEFRILALAKTHGLLGQQNWESVTVGDVLERILEPFRRGAGAAPSILVEGPAVRLVPKAALNFYLVFHELATN